MAKSLFTSTFTAQTLGFQSHNYGRVGGSAAVGSGDDVDVVDRFRAARSGCRFRLSVTTRRGRRSCESARRVRSHLASSGLESASVIRALSG
jgi:hypothetical protein